MAAHASLDASAQFHRLRCEHQASADAPFASHRLAGEEAASRKLTAFGHDHVPPGQKARAADLGIELDRLAGDVHVPADRAGNDDRLTGAEDIAAHGPRNFDPLGRSKDIAVHHASHDDGLAREEHGVVDGFAFGDLDGALFLVAQLRGMGRTRRDDAQRPQDDKHRCRKTKRRNPHVLTSHPATKPYAQKRACSRAPTALSSRANPVTERRSMAFVDRSVLSTLAPILVLTLAGLGCGDDTSASGTTPDPFVPEAYGEWLKFEPEGAVCANGSQYKYFVNFSETSSNVVIFLEGGGACSNYEDCSNGRPFNTDCIKEPAGAECIRDNYPAVYLTWTSSHR